MDEPRDFLLYSAYEMIRKVAPRQRAKANKSTNIWGAIYSDDTDAHANLILTLTEDSPLALWAEVFGESVDLPLYLHIDHVSAGGGGGPTGEYVCYLGLGRYGRNTAASPLFTIGPFDINAPDSVPKFYGSLETALAGLGVRVRFPYPDRPRAKPAKRGK